MIEELEQRHLEAEENRRTEQEVRDRELTEQTLMLEHIRQESLRLKKDAEEVFIYIYIYSIRKFFLYVHTVDMMCHLQHNWFYIDR